MLDGNKISARVHKIFQEFAVPLPKIRPETSEKINQFIESESEFLNLTEDLLNRTDSFVLLVTPEVIPEILKQLSEFLPAHKKIKATYYSQWDLSTYGGILKKMTELGNVTFQQVQEAWDGYIAFRDNAEALFGKRSGQEFIGIRSTQQEYMDFFSSELSSALTQSPKKF